MGEIGLSAYLANLTDSDFMKIRRGILGFMLSAMALACTDKESVKVVDIHLDNDNENVNCYTAVLPADGAISSYMLLLPGFGESPQNVLEASDLPYEAAKSGMAVFVPILQNGIESYSFSAESQAALHGIVEDIRTRYDLGDTDWCVGGFSMGGAAAVKYAESSAANPPVCVFAIDSPLDYERFRYATARDVEVYKKGIADGDSIYVQLLNDITPLVKDSPYLLSDTAHNAILPLKNLPVRYYIEPAVQWWLDNRNTDVLGLNILDGTAFINDLRLIGNDRAELIVTSGKGFRNKGKTYHPHSWTIVDTKDLLEWIQKSRQ